MAARPGDLDLHVPVSAIAGELPEALRGGRMLSNGPGWTRIGERTAHPFDGHGYVRAFDFLDDGSCRLTARFVRTPSYEAEAEAGVLVHRGFATNRSDRFWENLKQGPPRNVANTTIVPWRGELLAGWEAGRPYALDPADLSTRGEHDFGGALGDGATLAHMRKDASLGRLTLCSVAMGQNTRLTFRELDADDQVVRTSTATVPGQLFLHDYAFTPSCFIVGGNPLKLRFGALAKAFVGMGRFFDAVTPDATKPGTLHLIERGGDGLRTVSLPGPAFVVHFGNAFEREDGTVVVDACVFDALSFGEEFGYQGPNAPFDPGLPDARGPQRLLRITVPPGATTASWEPLTEHGVDFPRFHPDHEGRESPLLFGATRADTRFSDPFDSVLRLDLRTGEEQLWQAPPDVFVGEPLFAPTGDDEGYVLALLSHGLEDRTSLVVFAAADLTAGPVATVPLPLLPVAFHGDWVPR